MEYEYKSVILVPENDEMSTTHSSRLNDYFNQGWEYVDSIKQVISSGSQSYTRRGTVMIILKKKTETLNIK